MTDITPTQFRVKTYSLGQILKDGPELVKRPLWIVPHILPAGLTLLSGGPKSGKSLWLLNLALDIARGTRNFGIPESQSEVDGPLGVLYAALEDDQESLYRRIVAYDPTIKPNPYIRFVTEMERADEGGIDWIVKWLDYMTEHNLTPRLVIIDTLQCFRRLASEKTNSVYASDYEAMRDLMTITQHVPGLGVVVAHHIRKGGAQSTNFVNEVSGTMALTGAADTIMVLQRDRSQGQGQGQVNVTIQRTSRRVEDDDMVFSLNGVRYTYQGIAAEVKASESRRAVLDWLAEPENGGWHNLSTIAKGLNRCSKGEIDSLRRLLKRMASDSLIEEKNGCYKRRDDERRLFFDAYGNPTWRDDLNLDGTPKRPKRP
jgi:hypothetical protein